MSREDCVMLKSGGSGMRLPSSDSSPATYPLCDPWQVTYPLCASGSSSANGGLEEYQPQWVVVRIRSCLWSS